MAEQGNRSTRLLGHLVPDWKPEDAATRALAYILDLHASPGMAQAFVDLLGRTGLPSFQLGRVEHDPTQADDSAPDVSIRDVNGVRRILIETTFWKGVDDVQPAEYLREFPDDAPQSALVFITPRDRIPGLWNEFEARCKDSEVDLQSESSRDGDAIWARAGSHVLLLASWAYVLDGLRRAAENPAVEQDVVQLRGLTDRMDREAFLPFDTSEVTDVGLARRVIGYRGLVGKITDRLVEHGVVALKKRWSPGSYATGWMLNRPMLVRGKFEMRFGIELKAWRDSGITPLWWVLTSSDSYRSDGDWQRIKSSLDDVWSYGDSLYIPIRLPTGVEESHIVDDAVAQMRRVADTLARVTSRA